MIRELDVVALKRDLPGPEGAPRLKSGDVGTVVLVYEGGAGYELEFSTLRGESLAVVTVPANAVRSIGPREIANARGRVTEN